jgi:monoamine oxidase
VVVLEARDRLGGRIMTLRRAGLPPIELGAQVVHGDRSTVWNLIAAEGLRAAPIRRSGQVLVRVGSSAYTIPQLVAGGIRPPWYVEKALQDSRMGDVAAVDAVRQLEARELGRVVALEWLAQVWSADPAALSVEGMRRASAESLAGDGEFAVLDGFDRVVAPLARGLDVRLSTPVERVRWRRGSVRVEMPGGDLSARSAVITVPPSVVATGGLRFDPDLPTARREAAVAIPIGDAVTVAIELENVSDEGGWCLVSGAVGAIWQCDEGSNVARGWMKGPSARQVRGLIRDPHSLVRLAVRALPSLRPEMVREVHVADWGADPYAKGAFSWPKVGSLESPARWASPEDNTLFFAGEATCEERHAATVHGALESGERAALEVISTMGDVANRESSDPSA